MSLSKEEIELKQKEVDGKAKELSETHKAKITPLLFFYKGEAIVGFIKEPNREFKKKCIDLFYMGQVTNAGTLILEACLLQEESDPRIYSEAPADDEVYMGAMMEAISMVKFITNAIKKN